MHSKHENAVTTVAMEVKMMTNRKSTERLIKKYPNRRLYDTQTSAYITLADVKQLVMVSAPFTVVDARSGSDLTRSILLQIIVEEEASGAPLFTSASLLQIIRYYGHVAQSMLGSYLEQSIQAFNDIQDNLADKSASAYEGKSISPEMWTQFMNVQGPLMQGMMSNYIEQSKNLFVQMQAQMQEHSQNMLDAFPFDQPAQNS